MTSEKQVKQALSEVPVPGVMRSLVGLNLVRQIVVSNQRVNITLASAALTMVAHDWVKTKIKAVVEKLPNVNEVEVEFTDIKPVELNQIKYIIAVVT